jgi:hypothetical protein
LLTSDAKSETFIESGFKTRAGNESRVRGEGKKKREVDERSHMLPLNTPYTTVLGSLRNAFFKRQLHVFFVLWILRQPAREVVIGSGYAVSKCNLFGRRVILITTAA